MGKACQLLVFVCNYYSVYRFFDNKCYTFPSCQWSQHSVIGRNLLEFNIGIPYFIPDYIMAADAPSQSSSGAFMVQIY